MQRILVGLMAVLFLVGCESTKPLPYAAGDEGAAQFIRADYVQVGNKVQVVVDASAYKLNSAHILRSNGQEIQPLGIQRPQQIPVDFSTLGNMPDGYVGSGTSQVPNRGIQGGGNSLQSKTYIWFNMLSLGDAPWTLKLDVHGIGELDIELPAKGSELDAAMQTPTDN